MSRWRDRIRISGGFWLLAAWFTLVNGWQLLAVILWPRRSTSWDTCWCCGCWGPGCGSCGSASLGRS
ncbi:MAG: hypothetical protein EP146_16365 [Oscillibacter sp.]|uniref:hypothetical protein n=1 Tax=Oscillibacter sp. TaxID=1945593 RepID=UPI00132CA846|nr:hypothetical protein [Oscillibacter sp.]MUU12819.1 hypothetical protein [Oscillibacter sp.]